MDIILAVLSPVLEIATIAGFLALIVVPIHFFLKSEMGETFKDMTPWMGWTEYDAETDTLTPRDDLYVY